MKTCLNCKKEFHPTGKNQKFCNQECRKEATNQRRRSKYGTEYNPYTPRPPRTVNCKICNEPFETRRKRTLCGKKECFKAYNQARDRAYRIRIKQGHKPVKVNSGLPPNNGLTFEMQIRKINGLA